MRRRRSAAATECVDYSQWQPIELDDSPIGDQQKDLDCGYWAEIGPDAREGEHGWSWTILDFNEDNAEVGGGFAADEEEAKAAVDEWFKDAMEGQPGLMEQLAVKFRGLAKTGRWPRDH